MNLKLNEALETICMNDSRYNAWKKDYYFLSNRYAMSKPIEIWTEATRHIMQMKDVDSSKENVERIVNGLESKDNMFLLKETILYLLDHGDSDFSNCLEKVKELLIERNKHLYLNRATGKYESIIDLRNLIPNYKKRITNSFGGIRFQKVPDFMSAHAFVNKAIEICPDDEEGMTVTMLLLQYYNKRHNGRLEVEIETMKAKIRGLWNKEPKDRCDISCPFDDAQVKSSGISKEAKIVLAVMNDMFKGEHMNKNGSYSNNIDYAIAMFAVLSFYGYWKNQRKEYCEMLKQMFGVDVKADTIGKWIRQYGDNYEEWYKGDDGKEVKAARRKRIAQNFAERIDKVKTYKLKKIKN